jgi:hypothetical protein
VESEFESPIYSGPAREAKIAALAVVLLFAIWLVAVWPRGADARPGDDAPTGQLEEGTLPPAVGADLLPETE